MPSSRHTSIRLLVALGLAVGAMTVAAAPALAASADLVVTKVLLGSTSVRAGHSLEVTDVTANQGNARAGASVTKYYLSRDRTRGSHDVLLGKRSVGRLGPGKHSRGSVTVTVPKATAATTYHVIACADGSRKVAEKREGNNCLASGKLTVAKPSTSSWPVTANPTSVTPGVEAGTLSGPQFAFPDSATELTTTGSDGTTYTLAFPSGAFPRTLVMTSIKPLTSVPGAPTGLVGGVQIEPAGVQFDKDVTLTITPPGAVDRAALTGFSLSEGKTAGTGDYGLYPLAGSGPIVLHLVATGTYGVGTTTAAQRDSALAHPPTSTTAQVENVIAALRSQGSLAARRAALRAGLPWTSSVDAANAYWNDVLKPDLVYAETHDTAALDATTHALSFLRFWEVLGGAQQQWEIDAGIEIQKILSHAKTLAYTSCTQDHTMIDLLRLVIIERQMLLLGYDGDADDANDKFLRCAHFSVEITDHLTQSADYPQLGPAASYSVNYDFHVSSPATPLDINSSYQFVGTPTLTESVTGQEYTSHDCSPDPGTYHTTTTLTPSATGAVEVTFFVDLSQANYRLVGDRLVLKPPLESLQVPLSFINGPKESVLEDQVSCGGGDQQFTSTDTRWGFGFNDAQYPSYVPVIQADATGPTGAVLKDWTPPVYDHGDGTRTGGVHETNTYEVKLTHVPQ